LPEIDLTFEPNIVFEPARETAEVQN